MRGITYQKYMATTRIASKNRPHLRYFSENILEHILKYSIIEEIG